jgi:hypothetical protein
MSLNQRATAEFSTCTPSAPHSRDLSFIGLDIHKKTISYCMKDTRIIMDIFGLMMQLGVFPAPAS